MSDEWGEFESDDPWGGFDQGNPTELKGAVFKEYAKKDLSEAGGVGGFLLYGMGGSAAAGAGLPDVAKQARSVGAQVGERLLGVANRFVGRGLAADDAERWAKAYEQAAEEMTPNLKYPTRMARGVASSLLPQAALGRVTGSAAAPIALGTGQTYSGAVQEGRDVGLKEGDVQSHAVKQALWEALPEILLNRLGKLVPGLGGVESAVASRAAIKGLATEGRKAIGTAAGEAIGEGITTFGQQLESDASGVEPEAAQPGNMLPAIGNAMLQGAAGGAVVSAPTLVQSAAQSADAAARRKQGHQPAPTITPEAVQQVLDVARQSGHEAEIAALADKPQPSRADWEKAGLPPEMGRSGPVRKQFTEHLRVLLGKTIGLPTERDVANLRADSLAAAQDEFSRMSEQPPEGYIPTADRMTGVGRVSEWLKTHDPADPQYEAYERLFLSEVEAIKSRQSLPEYDVQPPGPPHAEGTIGPSVEARIRNTLGYPVTYADLPPVGNAQPQSVSPAAAPAKTKRSAAPQPATPTQPAPTVATQLATTPDDALETELAATDAWLADADVTDPDYDSRSIRAQLLEAELRKRESSAREISGNPRQAQEAGDVGEGGEEARRDDLQRNPQVGPEAGGAVQLDELAAGPPAERINTRETLPPIEMAEPQPHEMTAEEWEAKPKFIPAEMRDVDIGEEIRRIESLPKSLENSLEKSALLPDLMAAKAKGRKTFREPVGEPPAGYTTGQFGSQHGFVRKSHKAAVRESQKTEKSQPIEMADEPIKQTPAKPRLGKKSISRANVVAAFPQAKVENVPGGWRVHVGQSYVDVQEVAKVAVDWDAMERQQGQKYDAAFRKAFGAAGKFGFRTPDGKVHDGLGLIQLEQGWADNETLRHEALHLARRAGLLTDAEYQKLVEASVKPDSTASPEEQVAKARESFKDNAPIWEKIRSWIRSLLASIGIDNRNAADIFRTMETAGFWQRRGVNAREGEAMQVARDRGDAFQAKPTDTADQLRAALEAGPVQIKTDKWTYRAKGLTEDGQKIRTTTGQLLPITPIAEGKWQILAGQGQTRTTAQQAMAETEAPTGTPQYQLKAREDDAEPQASSLTESPSIMRISPPVKIPNPLPAIKAAFQKFLTSRGNLPEAVFKRKLQRDARISQEMQKLSAREVALKDALQKATGSTKLSDKGKAQLDAAMKGNPAALAALPAEVRTAMQDIRSHVDALSKRLIDNGMAQGDLELTIQSNLGSYITRSYQVFDDPSWAKKVPQDVRNRAIAWMKKEFGGETDQQTKNRVDDLLYKEGAPLALLSGGKLGSKDLSIFKRRKDIPPELRALMGEYDDPFVNYARSVTKMANLAANHEFLSMVKAEGRGDYFFDEGDPDRPTGYNAKIAADKSKALAPLDGMMTTPEIKKAFESVYDTQRWDGILGSAFKIYMKGVFFSKYAKTVLSPITQVRNFLGNIEFAIANGHWNLLHGKEGLKSVAADVRQQLPDFLRLAVKRQPVWEKTLEKYVSLGIVDQSVHGGELRDALNDAIDNTPVEITSNWATQAIKKGGKVAETLYRSADNLWKITAFENERARYKKAYEDAKLPKSPAELDQIAADIVRDTMPTYSMLPELVKAFRRAPVIAPFVSFASEVVRTKFHSLKLAKAELANPVTRSIGATRLAGNVFALSLPAILAAASRYFVGADKEDDEDLRKFVAPWNKHSDIMWLNKGADAKHGWVDLSYAFPSNYLRKPLNAFMAGKDWEGSMQESAGEVLEPYFGEELLAEAMMDVARNTTQQGRRVYNPQDSRPEQVKAMAGHIGKAMTPGIVDTANRNYKAWTGKVERTGRSYDPTQEALAVMLGARIQNTDIEQSLGFRARKYSGDVPDATSIFTGAFSSKGSESPESIKAAYLSANESRRKLFDEMHEQTKAAIRLGVPRENVLKTLASAGISEDEAMQVMRGEYVPYSLSRQMFAKIEDRPDAEQRAKAYWDGWREAGGIDPVVKRYESSDDKQEKELLLRRIREFAIDLVKLPGNDQPLMHPEQLPPVVRQQVEKAVRERIAVVRGKGMPEKRAAGDKTRAETIQKWKDTDQAEAKEWYSKFKDSPIVKGLSKP